MADPDIRFDEPCHEPWHTMRREGRTRHCDSCDKAVHDLDLYTAEEIELLLAPGNPPLCLAARIAPDGSVQTRPGRTGRVLTAAVALPLIAAAAVSPAGAATPAPTGHTYHPQPSASGHHAESHRAVPVPPPIPTMTAGIVAPPPVRAPQVNTPQSDPPPSVPPGH